LQDEFLVTRVTNHQRKTSGDIRDSLIIGSIRGIFAGQLRLQITRDIAGMTRMQIVVNIAEGIAIRKMRSRSAEVLLFLNSGLTTPWARGHRG
jgi:hypothetical protein